MNAEELARLLFEGLDHRPDLAKTGGLDPLIRLAQRDRASQNEGGLVAGGSNEKSQDQRVLEMHHREVLEPIQRDLRILDEPSGDFRHPLHLDPDGNMTAP